MLTDFDPGRRGKHHYAIAVPAGVGAGVVPDALTCITNGEGPTVVLTGGVHGDEFEAQIVLRGLAAAIGADEVRGRLVIVPSLNFPASQRGARIAPDDGRNMNRVFPGNRGGSPTEQLAALLTGTLFPLADLLIDVHAGGGDVTVVPMVFGFSNDRCTVGPAALQRILESWGYPYIEYVDGIASTACGAALAADIASVEIEGGGGGRLLRRELDLMRDGILRGLAAAGVLAPRLPALAFQGLHVTVGAENQIVAPRAGLVEHLCGLGDIVAAGTIVARLHPLAGSSDEVTEVASAREGVILRQTDHVHVARGQFLANTGTRRG
ncbi:MAG: succinylglutamate desuccinylase/aspartoacylase family protein [Rhodobacteraceae bacterium]|nr:succinylglutamate desuccinylase/aspartoacylase family protein [Paracoccaceae bacterium]